MLVVHSNISQKILRKCLRKARLLANQMGEKATLTVIRKEDGSFVVGILLAEAAS